MTTDEFISSEELGTDFLYHLCRVSDRNNRTFLVKTAYSHEDQLVAIQRLRQEFEICYSQNFEGLIRPIEFIDQKEQVGFIFEDMGGQPLDRILGHGTINLRVALEVSSKLANILAILHNNGYIHRDIRPSNILINMETVAVEIHGLGIAMQVPREVQGIQGTGVFSANPYYGSPEISGQTSRLVDYRTDFYSLGVTLFEMLTGKLPFASDDPLEVVHAHIAKRIPVLHKIDPNIPQPISDIVSKLMSKSAEDRYQGGQGIKIDLDKCLRNLDEKGNIPPFELGVNDPPARFELSQQLYGRELELEKLLSEFENIRQGSLSVMMVIGSPGIGKTSIIQELRKSIFARRGWFAAGKYDALGRGTPYSGIQNVLRDLWRQLLTYEPEVVATYRRKLDEVLGQNLGVIVNMAPELASIVGEPPPVRKLGMLESKNRLHLCMQHTLQAMATEDRPLVFFLDDLQWADQSSLELIEGILEKRLEHFMLLGSYRDNEVDEHHILQHTINSIKDNGINVSFLSLSPLKVDDIRKFVADSLRTDEEQITSLADLVFCKTAGNVFFIKALLTSIYESGFLVLNQEGAWTWDLQQIAGLSSTENVIDLAARKIAKVPERLRDTIAMASVIGSSIDIETLALALKSTIINVEADLVAACRERIFLKSGQNYQFEHDHLQETAYSLIPDIARAKMHLRIGRLLANQRNEDTNKITVFEIVAHYNRALDLIKDQIERDEVAHLNLEAGRIAKTAAAFPAAFQLFSNGLSLLAKSAWQDDYVFTLALHTEAAETASMTADFREADRLLNLVLINAHTLLDKIPAYVTKIKVAHAKRLETDAFQMVFDVVKLLGVELSNATTPDELHNAALEVKNYLEASLNHPEKNVIVSESNAEKLAAMRILARAAIVAGPVNLQLYYRIAHRLIGLAIHFDDSPETPLAYVMAGGMVCCLLDDYETGCRAGDYGMELLRDVASPRMEAICHFIFAADINCWRLHFEDLADDFVKVYSMALESGDLMTAGLGAHHSCETSLHAGQELGVLELSIHEYINKSQRIGTGRFHSDLLELQKVTQIIKNGSLDIRLSSAKNLYSDDGQIDLNNKNQISQDEVAICHEMMTYYLYRHNELALNAAFQANNLPWGCMTNLLPTDFYICLSILECIRNVVGRERESQLVIISMHQERIRIKAQFSPVNFQHKLDLVEAQRLRMGGEIGNARELFDKAIEGARRNRYVHEEALANELAAEFHLELGREQLVMFYLQHAVSAYGRWGAIGKLNQLYKKYPKHLIGASVSLASSINYSRPTESNLNKDSIVQNAQYIERAAAALTHELDFSCLLEKLMRIILQSTGAQRGFLLKQDGGETIIEASGSIDNDEIQVLQRIPIKSYENISHNIVRFVIKSHEIIVIGDAVQDERFSRTAYVACNKPKSILCAPIILRGKLEATLYLENNLIRDAFNYGPVAAIQLISSHAATALENARLHEGLKNEILTRTQTEDELRQALIEVAQLKDRLHAENAYLREEILSHHDFNEIIGQSDVLRKVLDEVSQVAITDSTVLILGETGTGKELIARAVHSRSSRKDNPMITVNCAALPANLIESELFGHEKGAFTGAIAKKVGRFELAKDGTIFLDEIGELPLDLQSKLLRVLQEGEIERVGSTIKQKINVRVIAATNRNLNKEADEGKFRTDLYYRLSVFPIELPPLRSRSKDIPLLVWYFIQKKQGELRKTITNVPTEVMNELTSYHWPGNIRELENVIERAIILSHGNILTLDSSIIKKQTQPTIETPATNLNDIERKHIQKVLEQCEWNVKGKGKAAEQLGMNPSTVFFRMKKLGIKRIGSQL